MNSKMIKHKFLVSLGLISTPVLSLTVLSSTGCNNKNSTTDDNYLIPEKSFYEKSNYYDSLEGLNGNKLYSELIKIQHNHLSGIKSYRYLKTIYKDAFKDLYYEKDGSLLDYSLTKQKAPQVNLRRFLLPFVKIWVSNLRNERLLHYIWLAMTKILVIRLTYACLKRN